jgi:hypothetical protein
MRSSAESSFRTERRRRALALLPTVLIIAACSDEHRVTAPIQRPIETPMLEIGEMRATVDAEAGTMTFEPIIHRGLQGAGIISAAIYGNQGVTVRIYNSPVVSAIDPANPARKTFTASVGIRNLLTYPIGDEQASDAPSDTIGIDIFMGTGPTVVATSSPCSPACSVTVKNADGARAFNAPAQKFWHYHDRLGAAGSATDTTRSRKVWTFEADTQVTNFSFTVNVNAPWPAPYETRWKVGFDGDSTPESGAGSTWEQVIAGAGGTIEAGTPSAGLMTMSTDRKTTQAFARYDSLASATSAYMEARLLRSDNSNKPEEVVIGMADDTKWIAIGLTSTRVGFLNANYQYAGSAFAVAASSFRTYQIRKFGADSVQLLIDGTRVTTRAYSTFPDVPAGSSSAFFFGGPGAVMPASKNVADQVTIWDYVTYEIGVATP